MQPLSDVRQGLSGILARFRREGGAAQPVIFGSHRKPEAIILPYAEYVYYEEFVQQRRRREIAMSTAQSVQVELPGPFDPRHDDDVSAYVAGELSAEELYSRTVDRYRRP